MASSDTNLLAMIRDSIATPREAAGRVLAVRLGTGDLLAATALVSILDALLAGLTGVGAIIVPVPDGSELTFAPLGHALALAALLVLSAGAFQAGGKILGGRGTFAQSLLVVIWLEVVALAIQVVQAAVLILLPPLAPVAALAGIAVLLWCLVHFVKALHGFAGIGRSILAVLLGGLGAGLGLSLLLAVLGFGGPSNV